MDSINRNQPENNRSNLTGPEAVERIREVVKKTESCFFCTAVATGDSSGVRPMSVQQVDDAGTLWFLSASDSHKNLELRTSPEARLFFQGSEHSGFLTLSGLARVSTDRQKIESLWNPLQKTWFTGGLADPRLTVIGFAPQDGYYWDNKHGDTVAGLKVLVGAALGKTLDDSIEGTLAL
jgi:general stress protein 26